MKTYRSSVLSLFSKYCPKALDHYEKDTVRDTAIFQVGIAAHAVLQDIGLHSNDIGIEMVDYDEVMEVADRAASNLMAKGRSFDNIPEPPIKPEDALEGRDLAVRWQMRESLSPTAHYERGLAIGPKGQPMEYRDEGARYKALIDAHEIIEEEDEDSEFTVCQIDEYKSAWPTDETELETLQCKGQAVIAAAHYPTVDVIRHRVVNLRTMAVYTREIMPNDEYDKAMLDQWRKDIFAACDAADYTRVARPGASCVGCPYMHDCEDAWTVFGGSKNASVQAYAVAYAMREHLAPIARELAPDKPVKVPGGSVGYQPQIRNVPVKDAEHQLAYNWFMVDPSNEGEFNAAHGEWLGLVKALKVSASNLASAAKILLPGRENSASREDLIGMLIEQKVGKTFGVAKGEDNNNEEGETTNG